MRYWGYLVLKLAVSILVMRIAWVGLLMDYKRQSRATFGMDPFGHDLGYTTGMFVFFLLCVGVLYLIILDQRYRCRTCLRRLRMPVAAGSWPNTFLIGQPRTEYICLYGHGTLKVPDLKITESASAWESHGDDIWKELESIEESKR